MSAEIQNTELLQIYIAVRQGITAYSAEDVLEELKSCLYATVDSQGYNEKVLHDIIMEYTGIDTYNYYILYKFLIYPEKFSSNRVLKGILICLIKVELDKELNRQKTPTENQSS